MYVHPDAQLVEIIDGEEFYSCDPIGFPNYMISRNGTLINRTTRKIRIPRIVETRSGKSIRRHAIVNLRQYEYQKTFDMTRIMGVMFIPNPQGKSRVYRINNDSSDYRISNLRWGDYDHDRRPKYNYSSSCSDN